MKKERNQLFEGIPEMEKSREACVTLLRTIISNLHRLEISTIDSFFVRTARVFSDDIGFSPHWGILDELQEKTVMCEAVSIMLQSNDIETITKNIRLAKTSTVVPVEDTVQEIQKYAYDIMRQTGENPWLWGTPQPLLSKTKLNTVIDNLESQVTEIKAQQNSIPKAVARARAGDWRQFLTTGLPVGLVYGTLKYGKVEIDPPLVKALEPIVKHAGAVILNQLLKKNEGIVFLMKVFNEAWSAVKHECGLYRFNDITHYLGKFGVLNDLQELAFRLDGKIDHLLIDEFQDTSLPQWNILELLVDEIFQSSSDRSLFFVGDPKQSLYGFRGGEPQLLRRLLEVLDIGKPIKLPSSWRCSTPVLDLVNKVFGNADQTQLLLEHSQEGIEEWMKSFETHVAARKKRLGFVEIHVTDVDETRKPNLKFTIAKVTEIVRDIHRNCKDASIGILVRKNTNQQIQRIVHALRTHGTHPIMASEHGGNPLTDSPQVTIILSALLMADHPGDTASLFHVSTSPLGTLLELTPTANRKDAEKVSTTLRQQLSQEGYANVILALAEPLFSTASERDQLRLWQLIELAESYTPEETLRPSDFVEFVKKKRVADPATSKVQVMTVHASKGLGFDAVVVCDLEQPLWGKPDLLMLHDDQCAPATRVSVRENEDFNSFIPVQEEMWAESNTNQVQEALSMLYVAMTRAKHGLFLVVPPRPMNEAAKSPKPSTAKSVDRFLRQALNIDECLTPNSIAWKSKHNDANWFANVDVEKDDASENNIGPISFAKRIHTEKVVASASPSSLEGGGKTLVASRFSGNVHIAFDWGTVVHSWFEDIEWLEGEFPTVESLLKSAPREEAGRLTNERVNAAASAFINALHVDVVEQLLTKPIEEVQLFNEQEFVCRAQKGTSLAGVQLKESTDIRGTIDRLVVFKDSNGIALRAEIIDWKTDRFDQGELDAKVENYAPQLASYRLAASKLLGLDVNKVTARLAFVMEGCVVDATEVSAVEIP